MKYEASENLSKLTDTCVKCGLCLPNCPTYKIFNLESESPRGRISLIEGLNRQELTADTTLNSHLAHCLGCGNCEAICPIPVEYTKIYSQAKPLFHTKKTLTTNLIKFIANRTYITWKLLAKVHFIVTKIKGYKLLYLLVKPIKFLPKHLASIVKILGNKNNIFRIKQKLKPQQSLETINLFIGCFNSILDQATTQAAVDILNNLGVYVNILEQKCCGLLSSETKENYKLSSYDHNSTIFINPACGHQLQINNQQKAYEIMSYIAHHPRLNNLKFKPYKKQICLHYPCTLANLVKTQDATYQLLTLIPEISISILPYEGRCCGAAGKYMLEFPAESASLIKNLLKEPEIVNADILVTNNIGCGLFFAANLTKINPKIQVFHPLQLINLSCS